MRPIERDLQRFKGIVKGEVQKRVREFLSQDEYLGNVDGQVVSIPMPNLELPHFVYGENPNPLGAGEGEGEGGMGSGGAGSGGLGAEGHVPTAELEFEEFVAMIGEALALPRLLPKGEGLVEDQATRYNTLSRQGPESLRHPKRTLTQALKRSVSLGNYDPDLPNIVPERDDFRYRAPKREPRPIAQAVVLFALDVSGSMEGEQLLVVKQLAYWLTAWIKRSFPRLERRYLLHDVEAWEVSEEEFFRIREGGGTRLSSAVRLAGQILDSYPESAYNRYFFHFTDGDNWGEDTKEALRYLSDLLPTLAIYGYGQIRSRYGQGRFLHDLLDAFDAAPELAWAEIKGRESVPEALKRLLGGRDAA